MLGKEEIKQRLNRTIELMLDTITEKINEEYNINIRK
jgi:hypothetical protein